MHTIPGVYLLLFVVILFKTPTSPHTCEDYIKKNNGIYLQCSLYTVLLICVFIFIHFYLLYRLGHSGHVHDAFQTAANADDEN